MTNLKDKWELLQRIIADPGLTDAAKVVAARLLGHHNNSTGQCNPSHGRIAKAVGKSPRRVIVAIHSLEDRGWLAVERSAGGNPKASHEGVTNRYRFDFDREKGGLRGDENDTPQALRGDANVTPQGCRERHRGGDENVTPRGVANVTPRGVASVTQTHKEEHGNRNTVIEHTGEAAPPPVEVSPPPVASDNGKDALACTASEDTTAEQAEAFVSFEEFWRHYPRKEKQKVARTAWNKALKTGHDPREIIAGAMRYAAARQGKEKRYTQLPHNWLDGECWTDELGGDDGSQFAAGKSGPALSTADVIRWRNQKVGRAS